MNLKLFRNFKIKTKLIVLEIISILGLIIVGGLSVYTAREINQSSTDISQQWLPSVIIAEDMNTFISNYRIKEYYYVISKDDEVKNILRVEMAAIRDQVQDGFDRYEAYISSDTDKEMMDQAHGLWIEYLKFSESLLAISEKKYHDEALDLIIGDSRALFDEASNLFLEVVNFNKEGAERASIRGDQLYIELTRTKIAAILLITTIITGMVIYVSKAIEDPIEAIVEGVGRVSNGDLDVYLDYRSKDEIGVLTDSVNALIKRLRDIIEDEKYLFREIGNENFAAKSNCERAYRGDFAPILYSIESLKSRLEAIKFHQKGKPARVRELKKGKTEKTNDSDKMDDTNKKS